jgi:catechol 2,3-dioxygenase-like lactoylglutathione lyase family enzyme
MIKSSTAVFAVADVTKSVEFYCNVLGFKQNWLWGNPPTFGCVGMGKAEVFLCHQPELAQRVEGHMHFFDVAGKLDELYAQQTAAGATIVSPPENKPWGLREYVVRDLSGYHLRFAGPQKYERPPDAREIMPDSIRIEVAQATIDEYVSLMESVNWNIDRPSMVDALAKSYLIVLARDEARGGEAVGIVRVTGAGKYFMIWDVIVRPSHQAMRIGSAMMKMTLAELKKTVPAGSFVGLFTPKPGFYEHFGFKSSGGMSLSL